MAREHALGASGNHFGRTLPMVVTTRYFGLRRQLGFFWRPFNDGGEALRYDSHNRDHTTMARSPLSLSQEDVAGHCVSMI